MTRSLGRAAIALMLAAIAAIGGLDRSGPAASAAELELSEAQRSAIEQITGYFNGMRTLQGEFMQVGPKGHISTGIFHISKPGRMRFEYAPPNPFVVVADGTWVTIKNNDKNTADQYPLSATPLRLVLAEQVDLLSDAKIISVEQADGLTTVTLEDKDALVPGHLVLIFDEERDELQQWIIVDGQGRRTTISLTEMVAGVSPDPDLFQIDLPSRRTGSNR